MDQGLDQHRFTLMSRFNGQWRGLLVALPLGFMAVFYFYPLGNILRLSFSGADGSPAFSPFAEFFSPPYLKILWFTFWQAFLSTLLTVTIALPGAFVYARYQFRGKRWINALTAVPFVLPTVVTAAAFRAFLGPYGLVNQWAEALGYNGRMVNIDQSIWFFLLAHVFYNYTLILRIVGGYWAQEDTDLNAAASMLGASPAQVFRKIRLPLLLPAIGSAALLVFMFCFTSFGVILILGGARFATLEVEIYRQAVSLFNLPLSAVLSLVQIATNFGLMWLWSRLGQGRPTGFFGDAAVDSARPALKIREKAFIGLNLFIMLILLLAPLAALVLRSVNGPDGLTPAYYMALLKPVQRSVFAFPPITAIFNSLGFALAAMVLALVIGMCAALFLADNRLRRTAFWDALMMLPLATSAVTLGFGYIISLNRPPLNLRDSILLVPLAHALVAFPFVVRCLLPTLQRIPAELKEAATLLGATPLTVWRRVELPLAGRAVLVGAVFAFSISMGEFGASAFVARPHTPTLPVAIYRFLSQPGDLNYGQAMAMSTILMLVTVTAFWALEKIRLNAEIKDGQNGFEKNDLLYFKSEKYTNN